jgi:hypothetical protein
VGTDFQFNRGHYPENACIAHDFGSGDLIGLSKVHFNLTPNMMSLWPPDRDINIK